VSAGADDDAARRRWLGSTYRLQVRDLGLARTAALVPYLSRLGVETLYLAPIARARLGSSHGYDVVDPNQLDPALGTRADLEHLLDTLGEHSMGLLIDIVPNHLAVSDENSLLWPVLASGPAAREAAIFDIDWARGEDKLVLAMLGVPLAASLDRGEIEITCSEDGEWTIITPSMRLPVAPPVAELKTTLEHQHYRLAYWRSGRFDGNYRRFFDVDHLIGVKVEDDEVYRRTHELVMELCRDERVAGVRVDHIDGLADPAGYLRRLAADLHREAGGSPAILVEKILERGEELAEHWGVEGTTGYDFADLAGGVLVDEAGAAALAERGAAFETLVTKCRELVCGQLFPGVIDDLARRLSLVVRSTIDGQDVPRSDVARGLVALLGQLRVYRTGLCDPSSAAKSVQLLEHAAGTARARLDADGARALDAIVRVLADAASPAPAHLEARALAIDFEQCSVAVAGKGVEDTACYRFAGLLGAAEVGGDPAHPSVAPAQFHEAMRLRQERWPLTMNATSTHDTKRSEDVRARLMVLSELDAVGRERLSHLAGLAAQLAGIGAGQDEATVVLSVFDVRFLLESALGIWPMAGQIDASFHDRLCRYAIKAAREAKLATSWLDPAPAYEAALERFVSDLVGTNGAELREACDAFVAEIAPAGALNSLAMLAIKATAPGIPDIYQGCEMWSLRLVDPDNRAPVDFSRLEAMLEEIEASTASSSTLAGWLSTFDDGRIKLAMTARLLGWRRRMHELYRRGRYVPFEVRGARAEHVLAFGRNDGSDWSITVVPRCSYRLAGAAALRCDEGRWQDTVVVLGRPLQLERAIFGGVVTPGPAVSELFVGEQLGASPVAVLYGSQRQHA
jgi:(1->4)-alpha-D-glucan 1-alpha-D-glucosylmutase